MRGHAAHDAVRIIRTRSLAKRFELGPQILGVLPGEPRVLRRNAGACRTVATGTCRSAFRRITAPPNPLPHGDPALAAAPPRLHPLGSPLRAQPSPPPPGHPG